MKALASLLALLTLGSLVSCSSSSEETPAPELIGQPSQTTIGPKGALKIEHPSIREGVTATAGSQSLLVKSAEVGSCVVEIPLEASGALKIDLTNTDGSIVTSTVTVDKALRGWAIDVWVNDGDAISVYQACTQDCEDVSTDTSEVVIAEGNRKLLRLWEFRADTNNPVGVSSYNYQFVVGQVLIMYSGGSTVPSDSQVVQSFSSLPDQFSTYFEF